MDNSLLIGKYMLKILAHDNALMQFCPLEKMFALMAHEDTKYPFVVFSRNQLSVQYTKDMKGQYGHDNTVQLTIDCHGNTYEMSIELANLLRNALEGKGWRDDDIQVDTFRLVSAYETTDGQTDFQQTLIFETMVE